MVVLADLHQGLDPTGRVLVPLAEGLVRLIQHVDNGALQHRQLRQGRSGQNGVVLVQGRGVLGDIHAMVAQSCYNLLLSVFNASRTNIEKAFQLLKKYDPELHKEILADEIEIDRMSDQVNNYMVGFLSHLQSQSHVSIMDQYYRVRQYRHGNR